ncbi:16992_t:CDS:2 [Cetraspora pellucida]|uniref:16992_t:CDS:1 n=1 Tax=Cetraspora pellucida TaxID=1433469 RepID=A0ACA9KZD7_9GLOM|nr:16992_t:CDS:2 [Cetraspora pellucida]
MRKELSEDLHWRVVYHHVDGCNEYEIAEMLYISQPSVNRILKNYNKWQHVINLFKAPRGKRKLFSGEELKILKNLVKEKVDWYLDELVVEMENLTGKHASISTLWCSLKHLRITHKKLQKAAYERNEIVCSAFIAKIEMNYTPEQLIFLDESAKDERSLTRFYEYAVANARACKCCVFLRGKRYTILPALSLDGIMAVDIMEGSCTKDRFSEFILSQVVSILILKLFMKLYQLVF